MSTLPKSPMDAPSVGDIAPDFDLPALIGGVKKRFRLADNRGMRNLLLAFYPFNWEPASTEQMVRYQVKREKLLASNAEVVGICVDSIMNTTVWEREIGPFDFPLCSDFWPHGEVCRMYGLLREHGPSAGASERAVLAVDKAGNIRFRKIYGSNEAAGMEEALAALS